MESQSSGGRFMYQIQQRQIRANKPQQLGLGCGVSTPGHTSHCLQMGSASQEGVYAQGGDAVAWPLGKHIKDPFIEEPISFQKETVDCQQ